MVKMVTRTNFGVDALSRKSYVAPFSLHLLEEVRVDARDDEALVLALDLHVRLAAEVARHARDGSHVDEGRAMDLPEDVGIEAVEELADRRLDERLGVRGDDARVFFIRLKEQHVGDRD